MIAVVQWLKRIIIVLKLILMVELWALLSPRCPHDLTIIGSVALRKGPWRLCPYRRDRYHALTLPCRNSRCEHCNNVLSSFYSFGHHGSLELDQLHIDSTWCALIGTSRKLAAYTYACSLVPFNNTGVWAGGCKRSLPRYPKGQSRTCYQESGCHS